jgi:site-specific DNA-methyltransferase (cytosine-N4-specific)
MTIHQRLSRVNWDFPDADNSNDIHSIHPYPAKFIPELPRRLILEVGLPANTGILDPFCGSGTTLVEAQSLGIPAVGIDLNPIACLISRVKTQCLPSDFLDEAEKVAEDASNNIPVDRCFNIPNVDHWFKPSVQIAVAALVAEIELRTNRLIKDGLRFALSSIIVKVSNQESDTRYAAIEKPVNQVDVFAWFLKACQRLAKAKAEIVLKNSLVKIINKNIFEVSPQEIGFPIGLVITSPPYPNAYEYWLYHKYRMWWLGYDPLEVKQNEIGARAHFFKKNHHTENDFRNQMRGTLGLLSSIVMPSGYICMVIGRSKIHGQQVDNATIIEEVAKEYNLWLTAKLSRNIASNRKSFNLAHANIKTEDLLILQKL